MSATPSTPATVPGSLPALALRALLAPAGVFAAHLFLSLALNAYKRVGWVDEAMHLAGGFTIALCFATLLDGLQRMGRIARPEPWLRGLLIFALTCTAAVLWEFAEFLSDRWLGTTSQLELHDTLGDLLMGLLGGLAFVVWSRAPNC